MFIGRTDAAAQTPIIWLKDSGRNIDALSCPETLLTLMWERLSEKEEGKRT